MNLAFNFQCIMHYVYLHDVPFLEQLAFLSKIKLKHFFNIFKNMYVYLAITYNFIVKKKMSCSVGLMRKTITIKISFLLRIYFFTLCLNYYVNILTVIFRSIRLSDKIY